MCQFCKLIAYRLGDVAYHTTPHPTHKWLKGPEFVHTLYYFASESESHGTSVLHYFVAPAKSSTNMGVKKSPTCRSIPICSAFCFHHPSFPLAIAPSFFISQSVDIALRLAVSWGKTHIPYGRIVFRLSDRASDSWRRGILFLFFVCYLSIPVK